jgi:hypothetical protein
MKLWIRSQDGILLEKAEAIKIANYDGTIGIVINNDYVFGEYKTKERAIEVLDEIQNFMRDYAYVKKTNGLGKEIDLIPKPILIYNMPKK